jgi:hypothetical protein
MRFYKAEHAIKNVQNAGFDSIRITNAPVRSLWILAIGQLIRKGHNGDQ